MEMFSLFFVQDLAQFALFAALGNRPVPLRPLLEDRVPRAALDVLSSFSECVKELGEDPDNYESAAWALLARRHGEAALPTLRNGPPIGVSPRPHRASALPSAALACFAAAMAVVHGTETHRIWPAIRMLDKML